jgi:hypothetical protein
MSAFITVPDFPNVPALPGVPALLRDGTGLLGSLPVLEVADAVGALGIFATPQWGIFDSNNNLVVEATSVISTDFRGDYEISDYPVEQGGFASYNKVIRPFDVRVTLTCAQSQANRTAFLTALEAARASLDLYQVGTPEYAYQSVNIVHVDYTRSARSGASMIIADVWLRQVIETATATFSNTASSSGADPVNGGTVQPTAASITAGDGNAATFN